VGVGRAWQVRSRLHLAGPSDVSRSTREEGPGSWHPRRRKEEPQRGERQEGKVVVSLSGAPPIPEGIKPPKSCAWSECHAKRQGRSGSGDGSRIFGRMKALKAEAQECCRGETDPAGRVGGPWRHGSLKA
jgi:hypothetical protein